MNKIFQEKKSLAFFMNTKGRKTDFNMADCKKQQNQQKSISVKITIVKLMKMRT